MNAVTGSQRAVRGLVAAVVLAIAALGVARDARAQPGPVVSRDYVTVRFHTGDVLRYAALEPGISLDARGYARVAVPPGRDAEDYLAELRRDPAIAFAELDGMVTAAQTPDDPLYADQASQMAMVGAPAGWDEATGAATVTIAVLDSGLDIAHEEFAGRLWVNAGEVPGNGLDDDHNGCVDDVNGCRFVTLRPASVAACGYTSSDRTGDILDDHGNAGGDDSHGTKVAGIAAATGNNGRGVAGIAWNVKIMPIKVLDCGPGGGPEGMVSDVAQGIEYAWRMGANIMLLSLAGPAASADKQILRDAIANAQAHGVIIVAAAGNYGQTASPGPGYPAAYTEYPNVIAVGAATNSGTWATYSAYGPAIDFAAPGNQVATTRRTAYGTGYVLASQGTSFAAPFVAGTFALLLSRNAGVPPSTLIEAARAGATPAPAAPHGGNWAGAGIINAGNALHRMPMRISGVALHDWKDVPPGTPVRATIDGIECGAAATSPIRASADFILLVRGAGEQAGCGAIGKEVRIFIGGQLAQPPIPWSGKDVSLLISAQQVSSVSPNPGALVIQQLRTGWSNIAHLEQPGPVPAVLSYLGAGWEMALSWDAAADGPRGKGAYHRLARTAPAYVNDWAEVDRYTPFWVYGSGGAPASLNPNPPPGRQVVLQTGWNNIVWTGASASIDQSLAAFGGKWKQVLLFDNATGTWLAHTPGVPRWQNGIGGFMHLRVYWIEVTEPVLLTMP